MGIVRHAGPEADVGEREWMEAPVVAERAVGADRSDASGLLAADLEAGHVAVNAVGLDPPRGAAALGVGNNGREPDT